MLYDRTLQTRYTFLVYVFVCGLEQTWPSTNVLISNLILIAKAFDIILTHSLPAI